MILVPLTDSGREVSGIIDSTTTTTTTSITTTTTTTTSITTTTTITTITTLLSVRGTSICKCYSYYC